MLLQYASFRLRPLPYAATPTPPFPSSRPPQVRRGQRPPCAAQPLYLPHANLPDRLQEYTSLTADLTPTAASAASSFRGRMPPRRSSQGCSAAAVATKAAVAAGAVPCDVEAPPPESLQRESDHNYRWLYRPLFLRGLPRRTGLFSPTLGRRSRLPEEAQLQHGGKEEAPPVWATACSFVHAAGRTAASGARMMRPPINRINRTQTHRLVVGSVEISGADHALMFTHSACPWPLPRARHCRQISRIAEVQADRRASRAEAAQARAAASSQASEWLRTPWESVLMTGQIMDMQHGIPEADLCVLRASLSSTIVG